MTKEDFKCELILFHLRETGNIPSDELKAEIQKLVDFAFNGA